MTETPNTTTQSLDAHSDEIDLIALAKIIWNKRRMIIITIIIFTIIGLFIAIFTPKQYSASSIMVPQINSGNNNLGGLSSLAAMAGFNMDMNTGAELSPTVYPEIVKSIPFLKELMKVEVNFDGYSNQISIYNFYTDPQYTKFNVLNFVKKFTIGLPGTILSALKRKSTSVEATIEQDKSIVILTAEERRIINLLSSSISLKIDQKQGVITLIAIMPEAKAAAQLGQNAQKLLQEKITEFKIKKAQTQLEFVMERYQEKEQEFKQIQEKLARFRDKNKNIVTELDKTELERLQSEYHIIFAVFTELAKQLESAQIQVKGETPVFIIIQPISVPRESFKPKRTKILITWIFFGGVVGIGWVFGKHFLVNIKKRWMEEGSEKLKV
ncbi:MAG: hypothetical protein KKG99_06225 [Bacteroidetes bacterium]|nr:hypothetical protein [Bacteroidota bacterium]